MACGYECVINGTPLTKHNKKYKTRCDTSSVSCADTAGSYKRTENSLARQKTDGKTSCLLIKGVPRHKDAVSAPRRPTESAPPRAACGQEGRTSPQIEGWCF